MSKILKIDDCRYCPHYLYERYEFHRPYPRVIRTCLETKKRLLTNDDESVVPIPDDCPLDDDSRYTT